MVYRLFIALPMVVFFMVSCAGADKSTDTRDFGQIQFPLDSMECINSDDYISDAKYTMLVYVNVDMCMECSMKQVAMYDDFACEHGSDLLTVLSISNENIKHLKYLVRSLHLKHLLAIDSTQVFLRHNTMLDEYATQVFLLDNDNKVIIDGDPFINNDIMKEYDNYTKK